MFHIFEYNDEFKQKGAVVKTDEELSNPEYLTLPKEYKNDKEVKDVLICPAVGLQGTELDKEDNNEQQRGI